MQEALEKAGVNEDTLAQGIASGMKAKSPLGNPDHHARHKFLSTGAELLDLYPAKKELIGVGTVDEVLDEAEKGEHAAWDVTENK